MDRKHVKAIDPEGVMYTEEEAAKLFPTDPASAMQLAMVSHTKNRILALNPAWAQPRPTTKAGERNSRLCDVLNGTNCVQPGDTMELRAKIDIEVWKQLVGSAAHAHRPVRMHVEYILAQYLVWENDFQQSLEEKVWDKNRKPPKPTELFKQPKASAPSGEEHS